ncbi:MAG: hypothetical protein H8E70_07755 [Candidatus Marinimicrobia bacterium]|nr:hypothetical protein [Candidatus Neomarinimicrobiota bacterium]
MIRKMFTAKTAIVLLILIGMSNGQDKILLNDLRIDAKQNGLFLTLRSSLPLKIENITGWVNEDWFYMTVHQAQGDTAELRSTQLIHPILAIENTNADESTQLALRIKGNIENYEFYLSDDEQTIIIALYYPAETVVAFLDQNESIIISRYKLNSRLRSVFYLTGGALTISGVISGDGSEGGNTELTLGLIILTGTYLYDLLTR